MVGPCDVTKVDWDLANGVCEGLKPELFGWHMTSRDTFGCIGPQAFVVRYQAGRPMSGHDSQGFGMARPSSNPPLTILPTQGRRLARFMPYVSWQALCDNSLASMIPSDSGM